MAMGVGLTFYLFKFSTKTIYYSVMRGRGADFSENSCEGILRESWHCLCEELSTPPAVFSGQDAGQAPGRFPARYLRGGKPPGGEAVGGN